MGYILPGVNTGGLPTHLVEPLLNNHEIKYFVETGTANGDSARWGATRFEKVWTIELVEGRAAIKDAPSNATFLEGDSLEYLPEIINEIKTFRETKKHQFVLFYLDAHFCGDEPNTLPYPECPLLDEIKCVKEYGEDAIIIIDDARLFLGSPPHPNNPTEWPSICDIFHLLRECFPYHYITVTDDYVLAVPIHVRATIDNEWRERFNIRYPNDADKLKSQVKDVYKALKNYME